MRLCLADVTCGQTVHSILTAGASYHLIIPISFVELGSRLLCCLLVHSWPGWCSQSCLLPGWLGTPRTSRGSMILLKRMNATGRERASTGMILTNQAVLGHLLTWGNLRHCSVSSAAGSALMWFESATAKKIELVGANQKCLICHLLGDNATNYRS